MRSPTLTREGPRYRFDDLEFWAEEGVIFIVDTRNGDASAVSCAEFADRATAIQDAAKRTFYPDEFKRLKDATLNMRAAIKDATDQGDPSNPTVIKQRLKDRRRAMMTSGLVW